MGLFRLGPPEELILQLQAQFSLENFVETGTYEGNTAAWATRHFANVWTIESAEIYFRKARDKYSALPNVKFICGDSREELAAIVKELRQSAVFWLDAHWSGGETSGEDDQCPILREIEIINKSEAEHFIFIDDARLFTSPPQPPHNIEQWADISAIVNALQNARNEKYIVISEDVIIAVPQFAKNVVAEYCRRVNAEIWREYSERHRQPESFRTKLRRLLKPK